LNTKFLFGNGFNNEVVPEGQPDKLVPPYQLNLIADGIINLIQTIAIPMYETTNLFGNMVDWAGDFMLHLDDYEFFRNSLKGFVAASVPPILSTWFSAGVGNSLVDEVWRKLSGFESAKGRLDEGIAFAHSGFLAPLLGALGRTRADGSQIDVNTLISYEGVYLDDSMFIDNPNLKRIINIWGTASLLGDGDFGPPTPSAPSTFSGASPSGVENINIRIEGAYHNDFSYNEEYWTTKINETAGRTPLEQEVNRQLVRDQQERNRKVNLFMRDLYQATLTDQTRAGDLRGFFEDLEARQAARLENGIWKIYPDKLRDEVVV
jgi:hypothetical protein